MSKIENENKEFVAPVGEQRLRSTNDFKRKHLEEFSKIANAKNMPRIAIMDEAFDTYLGIINNVADIDQLIAKTKGYWLERDLDVVKEHVSIEKCKTMTPYKKAYLFTKLRDATDRQRVFKELCMNQELDDLNLMNGILEKASNLNKDGSLNSYSLPQIANEIRIELSQIQIEFLQLVLGQKAVDTIRNRAKGKFPEISLEEEAPINENTMNPALPTVLAVTMLTKAAWGALPDSLKRKVHEAVKFGKTELAKKLVSKAADVTKASAEAVELFQDEQITA